MAKQLGVSPSTLSEVMKGKRNLSFVRALALASKLGLEGKESEYFCLLVQMEIINDLGAKESIQNRIEDLNPGHKVRNLSVDLFRTIGDWYHTAILYLSELDGFDFTPQEISKRLGVSIFEVEAAIERLLRLDLMKKGKSGKLRKNADFLSEAKAPNESLRRFHKQTLEKAIESLQTQTPQEKIVRTEQFAIDPVLLPEADQIMEEFVTKLTKLFLKSKKKTEVYHLGIQLFNLTKKRTQL